MSFLAPALTFASTLIPNIPGVSVAGVVSSLPTLSGLQGLGLGLSALGAFSSAGQAQQQNFAAQQQAAILRQQATETQRIARLDAEQQRLAGVRQRKAAIAKRAVSGVEIFTGSSLLALEAIEDNAEAAALATIRSSNFEASRLRQSAAIRTSAQRSPVVAGLASFGTGALTAGLFA